MLRSNLRYNNLGFVVKELTFNYSTLANDLVVILDWARP